MKSFGLCVALKTEHERQLNEITERFEGIKHSLSVRSSTADTRLYFMQAN